MDPAAFAHVPAAGTFQTQHTSSNVNAHSNMHATPDSFPFSPLPTSQTNQFTHSLCCLCGVSIPPNPAGMCVNCIRTQVDITEGIQKQVTILWCKQCTRYLQPPKHWVAAEPESKELLTFCIKRIRGLGKVKLVDASFIWTEPHSMRLKVKLTVQGEVLNGAILQQSFVVEFIVERNMCPTCCKQAANPNSWVGCAQVRQHVPHKRTFFYLEQLILKHGAHEACINVKEMHEGVDFYFASRPHALKFIDFLQSVVPIKYRADKQLVSHNEHSSTYNYKYTFSVEIAPICKDDLIFLSPKVSSSFGGLGPLVLCTRVTNTITLIDPATLRHAVLETGAFWRTPLRPILSSRQLVEYVVLDVEPIDGSSYAHSGGGGGGKGTTKKLALAEVQVARLADFGANDKTLFARTHLGNLLHPGDHAFGYDLLNANAASDDLDKAVHKGWVLPDVVLVRKSYEEKRRAKKAKGAVRPWKLERMAVEQGDEVGAGVGGGGGGNRGKGGQDAETQDMERFLEELEEDPEMRSKVALYKDHEAMVSLKNKMDSGGDRMGEEESDDDDDDSLPEVPLEELLEDLAAMQLAEGDAGGGDNMMIE